MVDVEALARRARRAAEWGRLRSAARIALWVLPCAVLALALSPNRPAVAAIGLALLALTVWLGWRNAEGARAARAGLKLGAVPMSVGLVTIVLDRSGDPLGGLRYCGYGCLLAGLFVGGASTWYALRTQPRDRLRTCAQVGLVASLTTAIGCIGLGLGSALAVLGAISVGVVLAWAPIRART